ncbi:MBL fold metallo-hydrolase [Paenibacillus pinisoli]|uniref:MBL fold metallo-hydrolase n=1 Tax=Paenibacillus pinisoli TaxID=1276110 RepID=A0A3A6PCN3_9BACL|nr:MBL fold metallo-hydrolase [Paenibacillus pinisoli]RJX37730.1 MBL fold metallo-hydrolase [Paenibacillus pinisoli]
MTTITFRGTGDSQGVPRSYCDCGVCSEARATGRNRRFRPSLQIEDPQSGATWIDCGPDWGRQMESASLRVLERMLITHAHYDHIGGLPEWYDACRWTDIVGEAHVPPEVIPEIASRFPWISSRIRFIPMEHPLALGPWLVSCFRVHHGRNGYSYAFEFVHTASRYRWIYCPDAFDMTEQQQQPFYGADLVILGTSFVKEPYPRESRSIYDVEEAVALFERWKAGRMILTHMSHDIDVNKTDMLPQRVQFARTGMCIPLCDESGLPGM